MASIVTGFGRHYISLFDHPCSLEIDWIDMSNFNPEELKYYALIFGVILLVVFLYRKAIKKVQKDQEARLKEKSGYKPAVAKSQVEKPAMTEEQFNKAWKSLSYLILLAGAGNLYMAYTAIRSAIQPNGLWVWWIDAVFSVLAAIAAFFMWRKKEKLWVFIYFILLLVPIFLFMSIKGTPFKVGALIHLFPLVLLYFALKPIWSGMKQ